MVTRENNASVSAMADTFPLFCNVAFIPLVTRWLTEWQSESVVYRKPIYTLMVLVFYSHRTAKSAVTSD